MESWLNGGFDASLDCEYIARNSLAKGYCNAFNEILTLKVEDLFSE